MELHDVFGREYTLLVLKAEDLKLLAKHLSQALLENTQTPIIPEKDDKPITQNEAVKFLGKSRQTLIAWRKKNLIQAYKISGRIYYKPSELVAALERI